MRDYFGRCLVASIIIHLCLFVRIPLTADREDTKQELTEKDIDFLLSHIMPRSVKAENTKAEQQTKQNTQMEDEKGPKAKEEKQDAKETKEEKVFKYVYDVVRPKVYDELKSKINNITILKDVIITMEIKKDGSVERVQFSKSSGNEQTDSVCLDAIREASPFPSLEKIIDMDSIVVNCRFRLSELK